MRKKRSNCSSFLPYMQKRMVRQSIERAREQPKTLQKANETLEKIIGETNDYPEYGNGMSILNLSRHKGSVDCRLLLKSIMIKSTRIPFLKAFKDTISPIVNILGGFLRLISSCSRLIVFSGGPINSFPRGCFNRNITSLFT